MRERRTGSRRVNFRERSGNNELVERIRLDLLCRTGTEPILEAKLNRGAFQSTFPGKFHSGSKRSGGAS